MKFSNYLTEESLLKALDKMQWHDLTPVQEQVIPRWMKPMNIVVQAKPAAGKRVRICCRSWSGSIGRKMHRSA